MPAAGLNVGVASGVGSAALMVYVALAISLFAMPSLTAIALIVVVAETLIAALYAGLLLVGVVPSVV